MNKTIIATGSKVITVPTSHVVETVADVVNVPEVAQEETAPVFDAVETEAGATETKRGRRTKNK